MNSISIIVTAKQEPKTIGKALEQLANKAKSGYSGQIQLIQISPDDATKKSGENYIKSNKNALSSVDYLLLTDDNIGGKPHALNKALKNATGDIVVLTDGDVYFETGALAKLINSFKKNNFDIACGKPVSLNPQKSFMGYISHLMTAAADHKRLIEISKVTEGHGTKLVEKSGFFPLSGYILIFDRKVLEEKLGESFVFPTDCLVDDAYLSYVAFNKGLRFGYIPEAEVKVKFPTSLSDYVKQKKRSTGGFIQLWKYGVVKKHTNSRSFWKELQYFWFPFKYWLLNSEKLRGLIYIKAFYPVRLWLWLQIFIERRILKKDFVKTWVIIESTK